MNKENIFKNKLILPEKENDKNIKSISKKKIIKLFKKNGIIIFRNYNFNHKNILKFTSNFTSKYANDANRRNSRDESNKINEVDYGYAKMSLHSEASFSPSWPEIVWFFCNDIADNNSGKTTFCDGQSLWKELTLETKNFFLQHPLKFKLNIPLGFKKKKNTKKWDIGKIGTSIGELDYKKGYLRINQIRFAVNKNRFNSKLNFSNHFLYKNTDPTILSWHVLGYKKIPKKVISEVEEKSSELTYEHDWKKFDLIMVDNRRFLHGRTALDKKIKRDILNIQTLEANF